MKTYLKPLALLLALTLTLGLCACSAAPTPDAGASEPADTAVSDSADTADTTDTSDTSDAADSEPSAADSDAARPATDRAGNAITLPDEVQRIVVLAPAFCETLYDLGCAERIVGIDTQTQGYAYDYLDAALPAFDMMSPDCEQIAALAPDLVLVSGMTDISGSDLYAPLKDLGICVAAIPSAESIEGIRQDIAFLAACVGRASEGARLVADLDAALDEVAAIGSTVTDKKTVYFEISAAPYCYSFGTGTFLNEMIELIGAENVLADQSGWLPVEEESAVAADPDVILTSVNYLDDPVAEILAREGWAGVTAVAKGQVYYIDAQSSGLPNENIVTALRQMAQAVYPELYGQQKAR